MGTALLNSCKMKSILLLFLFSTTISSSQLNHYQAKYILTSMFKLDGTEPQKEDWLKLDTFNVKSNNCVVVLSSISLISDGKIAYFESIDYKSNINDIDQANSEPEKIIIDYKRKKIYFLNEKKSYDLIENIGNSTKTKDPLNFELSKEGHRAKIKLSKEIPAELRGKLIAENMEYGVESILTANQELKLISYDICIDCIDLKKNLKKAREICVHQDKCIDLIFPKK